MVYSTSAILTTIVLSSIMIIFVRLIFENVKIIKYVSIKTILFCIMLVAVRLLFPIELNIAKNVPSKFLMTKLIFFLEKPLVSIKSYNIAFHHIFFVLWLLGIIYISLKLVFIHIKFNKVIKMLPPIKDRQILKILEKVVKYYPYYKEFKIVQGSEFVLPFIYDGIKPIIVLPKTDFTNDELHYILSHEVAHHYNYDFLFKHIICLLCIVYWWNPIIFLLRRQITIWLEIQADITATKYSNTLEKISYFECLLKIAKNFKTVKSNRIISSFHNNIPLLKKRFYATKFYSKEKVARKKLKNNFCLIIFVTFAIYMSFSIVFEPYYIEASKTKNTVELTSETAYLFQNKDGNYDIYFNGKYYATVNKVPDSLSELSIYK